jgi:DNA-binding response OmpR family regulator
VIGAHSGAGATIQIVDDERKIAEIARAYLERDGFRVITAADGEEALRQFRHAYPALIVLDLMLPRISGWDVCRAIRAESQVPIILLTARDDVTDKVLGLELGADDYMTKPFEPRELVARVRAHLRRANAALPEDAPRRWGDLEVDVGRREVRRGESVLDLTRSEFELLSTMTQHPGRVYTRLQLLEASQGDAYEGYERTIDSHVKNLRHKIEPDPHRPRYIQTVFGVGYRAAPAP